MSSMSKKITLARSLPYILLVGGIIGLIASLVLSYDTLKIASNPTYVPSCSLNPVLSCGNVIESAEGHSFGIPNPFFGIAAFAVLITVGVSILAGAKFKRWFWIGLEVATVLGMAFAYWLLGQSVYHIRALCPFCLTVDVVVITTFWYVTIYNLQEGYIKLPSRSVAVSDFIRKHHLDILLAWFIVLIVLILQHFWYYYGKYL